MELEPVAKISHFIPISTEAYEEAKDFAEAYERWWAATPAQRAEWARQAADRRAHDRGETAVTDLSLPTLLDALGWSETYARHFVQPYCSCGPDTDGGWSECAHARDLGLQA